MSQRLRLLMTINKYHLKNKRILITGGTGTLGHALTQHLLSVGISRIIIFSRDEHKQEIMRAEFPDARMDFFLGDVRDYDRVRRALNAKVHYVIHAAALKRVPALEHDPEEALKTNVTGTWNVIRAALDCDADCRPRKVIMVSSDKGVNPTNLYGATKLCAERLTIQANSYSPYGPIFAAVRYGNVIGSRGSLLEKLGTRNGERPKLTHVDMTRFWIRQDDAARFVCACIHRALGGEIFVPDMPACKIADLLRIVTRRDDFEMVGIRPGEKIHETLISVDEGRHTAAMENYYVIWPEYHSWTGSIRWRSLGRNVPEGFSLTSQNARQLSANEIDEVVK